MDSLHLDEENKAQSKYMAFPLSPSWMCELEKKDESLEVLQVTF